MMLNDANALNYKQGLLQFHRLLLLIEMGDPLQHCLLYTTAKHRQKTIRTEIKERVESHGAHQLTTFKRWPFDPSGIHSSRPLDN
jgi:hypothetical protein